MRIPRLTLLEPPYDGGNGNIERVVQPATGVIRIPLARFGKTDRQNAGKQFRMLLRIVAFGDVHVDGVFHRLAASGDVLDVQVYLRSGAGRFEHR